MLVMRAVQLDLNREISIPFLDLVVLVFRTAHVMATLNENTVVVGLWGAASEVRNKSSTIDVTYRRYVAGTRCCMRCVAHRVFICDGY
jgi:hypothetical protein